MLLFDVCNAPIQRRRDKPHTVDIKYYSQPLPGWQFHQDDLPKVRHRIKQYKKINESKTAYVV